MGVIPTLLECIKRELNSKHVHNDIKHLTHDDIKELYALSSAHDIAHIVAKTLKIEKIEIEENLNRNFEYSIYLALYRYEQRKQTIVQITKELEVAEICHILLKGAVLSEYYPEPWVRTSCDIDILVHRAEVEKAVEILVSKLGYHVGKRGTHDIQLLSPLNENIELHFDLIETMPKTDSILSTVWERSQVLEGTQASYTMSDEMFYFYHIAHMAKHFSQGGCGVRSFIDVWILNNKLQFDERKRCKLLEEGGLLEFAKAVRKLSEVWFGNETHDELTENIEHYILEGGTYGSLSNRVLMQRSQWKNQIHYVFARIFMPYRDMKIEYPILKQKSYLLPIFWVFRWFKWLGSDRKKHSKRELQIYSSITQKKQMDANELVTKLKLEIPSG